MVVDLVNAVGPYWATVITILGIVIGVGFLVLFLELYERVKG